MNKKTGFISKILILAFIFVTLFSNVVFAEETDRVASITEVSGTVTITKSGGEREFVAYPGMSLVEGDTIITSSDSAITLNLDNDKDIRIYENSYINISELSGIIEQETSKTGFTVFVGKIWSEIKQKLNADSRYEIKTPTAVLGVRGTKYYVSQSADNTDIAVLEGFVAATPYRIYKADDGNPDKVEVILEKGQQAQLGESFNTAADMSVKEVTLQSLDLNVLEAIKASPEGIDQKLLKDIDKVIEQKREEKLKQDELKKPEEEIKPVVIYDEAVQKSSGEPVKDTKTETSSTDTPTNTNSTNTRPTPQLIGVSASSDSDGKITVTGSVYNTDEVKITIGSASVSVIPVNCVFTYTTEEFQAGQYGYNVVAVNQWKSSNVYTNSVTVASKPVTTLPELKGISVVAGSDKRITVSGSAYNANAVKITIGSIVGYANLNNNTFAYTTDILEAGTYQCNIVAVNDGGYSSEYSAAVKIDSTSVITVPELRNISVILGTDHKVTVSGSVYNAQEVYISIGSYWEYIQADEYNKFTFTTGVLEAGQYIYSIVGIGEFAESVEYTGTVSVTALPELRDIYVASNADGSISVMGAVYNTDNVSLNIRPITAEDGKTYIISASSISGNAINYVTPDKYAAGIYCYEVIAGVEGNQVTVEGTVTISYGLPGIEYVYTMQYQDNEIYTSGLVYNAEGLKMVLIDDQSVRSQEYDIPITENWFSYGITGDFPMSKSYQYELTAYNGSESHTVTGSVYETDSLNYYGAYVQYTGWNYDSEDGAAPSAGTRASVMVDANEIGSDESLRLVDSEYWIRKGNCQYDYYSSNNNLQNVYYMDQIPDWNIDQYGDNIIFIYTGKTDQDNKEVEVSRYFVTDGGNENSSASVSLEDFDVSSINPGGKVILDDVYAFEKVSNSVTPSQWQFRDKAELISRISGLDEWNASSSDSISLAWTGGEYDYSSGYRIYTDAGLPSSNGYVAINNVDELPNNTAILISGSSGITFTKKSTVYEYQSDFTNAQELEKLINSFSSCTAIADGESVKIYIPGSGSEAVTKVYILNAYDLNYEDGSALIKNIDELPAGTNVKVQDCESEEYMAEFVKVISKTEGAYSEFTNADELSELINNAKDSSNNSLKLYAAPGVNIKCEEAGELGNQKTVQILSPYKLAASDENSDPEATIPHIRVMPEGTIARISGAHPVFTNGSSESYYDNSNKFIDSYQLASKAGMLPDWAAKQKYDSSLVKLAWTKPGSEGNGKAVQVFRTFSTGELYQAEYANTVLKDVYGIHTGGTVKIQGETGVYTFTKVESNPGTGQFTSLDELVQLIDGLEEWSAQLFANGEIEVAWYQPGTQGQYKEIEVVYDTLYTSGGTDGDGLEFKIEFNNPMVPIDKDNLKIKVASGRKVGEITDVRWSNGNKVMTVVINRSSSELTANELITYINVKDILGRELNKEWSYDMVID